MTDIERLAQLERKRILGTRIEKGIRTWVQDDAMTVYTIRPDDYAAASVYFLGWQDAVVVMMREDEVEGMTQADLEIEIGQKLRRVARMQGKWKA